MNPLAIDLYCGLGGWTEGLLAEGWDVVGFDIERHRYGEQRYPAQLVIQDILTLHGSQFKDAALIVGSPPCQAYSSRGMPWNALTDSITPAMCSWADDGGPVNGWVPCAPIDNTLFQVCFCIQAEACEAAGHHIPLIVENVNRAQRWVGLARWHYGSYYLWGDVPALMPWSGRFKGFGVSWFAQNHNAESGSGGNPVDGTGIKTVAHVNIRDGFSHTRHLTNRAESAQARETEGVKQRGSGAAWFDKALDERRKEAAVKVSGDCTTARKAASAQIAKIPFELARWIAYCFKP